MIDNEKVYLITIPLKNLLIYAEWKQSLSPLRYIFNLIG